MNKPFSVFYNASNFATDSACRTMMTTVTVSFCISPASKSCKIDLLDKELLSIKYDLVNF